MYPHRLPAVLVCLLLLVIPITAASHPAAPVPPRDTAAPTTAAEPPPAAAPAEDPLRLGYRDVRGVAARLAPADARRLAATERILVRFRPGVGHATKVAAHDPSKGRRLRREYRIVSDLQLVEVQRGEGAQAIRDYRANPAVLYAEPDYDVHALMVPNDPRFPSLWGLHNTGQTVVDDPGTAGADIDAVQAWDSWRGAPNFRLAVIDTGVDYTHPDLAANIWINPGEIPGNYLDDDANGYVDDIHGYDFYNDDGDPMDDHFHGTHVAGTIGAQGNNGIGVVGVNWQCKIVAIKFLGATGSGSTSDAISSVEYAVANNIRLSNNSWGGGGYSQALVDAIAAGQTVGHLFIAAAGNSARNNDVSPHYPGAYNLPNIITVAATNNDDELASFSNYGLVTVDLGAPGVRVLSSVLNSSYSYLNGTSMAAPHVTGVAALVSSFLPGWTWQQVRAQLLQTVRPIPALQGVTVSGGVVNAMSALGDCNQNGVADSLDIAGGTSQDCTGNGIPDECEADCDGNGRADSCDLLLGAPDCTGNGVLDVCEPDCNANGIADSCDIASGYDTDCNTNAVPDDCETDCNNNGVADTCDVANGTSEDCTNNGILDECEPDCNQNGTADSCDLKDGTSRDCNRNAIPDECDIAAGAPDCTGNGIIDTCEFDCNRNGIGDSCDIASGVLHDADGNGVADECVFGMFLVPVSASGPHTIVGNRIILPQGGQTVTVDFLMSGWDPDLNGVPRLRTYEMAIEAGSLTNGLGGDVVYHRVPCVSDGECRSDTFCAGKCLPEGYCNECSALSVDASRPDYVFYDLEEASGVFLNQGAPPLMGALVMDPADAAADGGAPVYGGTILLDVPPDAEGTFTVAFDLGPSGTEFTFWVDPNSVFIPIPNLVPLIIELPKDCNKNGVPDEDDIAGGAADCNTNGVPDECIGRESDCNANLVPDACDIDAGTSQDANANGIPDECEPPVIYVDRFASGQNTGMSWADAFTSLQDALDAAAGSGGAIEEIWVAQGTYKPSRAEKPEDPIRTKAFSLVDGIRMYGGFAGGETSREQRDVAAHPTILSGDLNGDDGPNFANNAENSYHVVTTHNTGPGTVLDGFTMTAGNANGGYYGIFDDAYGAGLLTRFGSPVIVNCTFIANTTSDVGFGGGLAVRRMGAIGDPVGFPKIFNCKFLNNKATGGGAFLNHTGIGTLVNCLFIGNKANTASGGAVYIQNASQTVGANFVNCTIVGNRTTSAGGGGTVTFAPTTFVNCLVAGNTATGSGNVPGEGKQMWIGMRPTVIRTFIENWTGVYIPGDTIITGVPGMADPDGADNVYGTPDDDVRLTPTSQCIDYGDNAALPADTADLDGDGDVAEPTPLDLLGSNRRIDHPGLPDVGAPPGDAPYVDLGIAEFGDDCNRNGIDDALDIANGTSQDCNANGFPDECEPDCNTNGVADGCDIAAGTSPDCDSNQVPDECSIAQGSVADCDGDGVPDLCQVPPLDPAAPDCNGNMIPDRCEGDCNNNDVPDDCDLGQGTAQDCNANGRLDVCDLALGESGDCNGNAVPDECDLASGTSGDCNYTNLPDECELAGNDCNRNEVPDECDVDCDGTGSPDECESFTDCNADDMPDVCQLAGNDCNRNLALDGCDIASGSSLDANGNAIPDECEAAPALAPYPHSTLKNRYVSFSPYSGLPLAYRVDRPLPGGPVTTLGWVGAPDSTGVSRIVSAPVARVWWEPVIHVGACQIVPAAVYEVRTTADYGQTLSTPRLLPTAARPMPKYWGDTVGVFDGVAWTPPNNVVAVSDFFAAVRRFQGDPLAPHITWVDVHDVVPNGVINLTDVFLLIKAFQGEPCPYSGLSGCN
ncbi:MAG: S8 family serine peptidase [Planctomycetes bacterium]|nr:S8 family serine peptidase [Planctomycetota bacterium]